MIQTKARISSSLQRKLTESWMKNNISDLVDAISHESLNNIKEYGFGSARGNIPSGGSPIWQGKIHHEGHYRGYLTESHYIKKNSPNHSQIVSSADFVDGVISGYSTNWEGVRFGANNYHKRAIDKVYREGKIPVIWNNVIHR